jgi:hypothetical protein
VIRLVERLSADTSSWLCASLNGWSRPISQESLTLADLFDLVVGGLGGRKAAARIGPHPSRPWKVVRRERWGDPGGRTPQEVRALLTAARDGLLT